ncbi:hypothetical protein ACIGT4_29915 [Streptomyces sioyaensis]|uniref:hypothetical protein n=1 Tax=Streptomyces sioyaensis TaxID=67364 RepID=UPI0037CF356A
MVIVGLTIIAVVVFVVLGFIFRSHDRDSAATLVQGIGAIVVSRRQRSVMADEPKAADGTHRAGTARLRG